MKFTAVLTAAAAVAGVAAAPVAAPAPQAVAEADAFFLGPLLNLLGFGSYRSNYYYHRKVTVIRDSSYREHYYNFPTNYAPCGCDSDAYYQISEDTKDNLIQDAAYAVVTETAVTVPDDQANAVVLDEATAAAPSATPTPA